MYVCATLATPPSRCVVGTEYYVCLLSELIVNNAGLVCVACVLSELNDAGRAGPAPRVGPIQ